MNTKNKIRRHILDECNKMNQCISWLLLENMNYSDRLICIAQILHHLAMIEHIITWPFEDETEANNENTSCE